MADYSSVINAGNSHHTCTSDNNFLHNLSACTVSHKKCNLIFDYNSCVSWSIFFISFVSMKTGINTAQ